MWFISFSFIFYNWETWEIKRLDRKNWNWSIDKDWYLIIKYKWKWYKSHRLAWLYYYWEFPKYNIDHINWNRTDNRIINLRDVKQKENCRNKIENINKNTWVHWIYIDNTKWLKKKFASKYEWKSYRFFTLEEAIDFRKTLPINIRKWKI